MELISAFIFAIGVVVANVPDRSHGVAKRASLVRKRRWSPVIWFTSWWHGAPRRVLKHFWKKGSLPKGSTTLQPGDEIVAVIRSENRSRLAQLLA